MNKKILATCLSVFFATSAFALASCESPEENVTGLAFELVDGNYTVTGRGTCEDGIIEIPSTYNKKPVTAIADNAFENDMLIGIIKLPDSVTTIGKSAFSGCANLSDIEMGNGVTELGEKSFYNCGWLSTIDFSDSLVSIGSSSFYGCRRLKAIELPDSLTTIGNGAFDTCSLLADVTFGKSLEVIGEKAFYQCVKLKAIEIPDEAPTEIMASAFEECTEVQYIYLGNSVTTIGSSAFASMKVKELVIGDSVKSIGPSAFSGCSRMYTLTLGKSVISIGDGAFTKCRAIREIYNRSELNIVPNPEAEPTDFGEIGKNVFYVRTGNQPSKLSIDPETQIIYYINGGKKIVVGALLEDYADIVLPDDVDEIASRAFYNVDYIRSIDTGNGCKAIGASAFQNCYHLEKVVIGKSVKTIGSGAFYRNRVLVTVVLRSKLEGGSVGENAFWKYTRKSDGSLEKSAKEFNTLFFEGTSAEWAETKKKFTLTGNGNSNGDLIANSKVKIAYYSETAPTAGGNYWRFVDGKPTLWK